MKIADIQAMTQAITHAFTEAAKSVVQAMAVAWADAGNRPRSIAMSKGPKPGRPSSNSHHLTGAPETSILRNFQMKINNIFWPITIIQIMQKKYK